MNDDTEQTLLKFATKETQDHVDALCDLMEKIANLDPVQAVGFVSLAVLLVGVSACHVAHQFRPCEETSLEAVLKMAREHWEMLDRTQGRGSPIN